VFIPLSVAPAAVSPVGAVRDDHDEFPSAAFDEDALLEEVRRHVAMAIGTGQPLSVERAANRIADRLPDVPLSGIVAALVQAAAGARVAIRFRRDPGP
jgi:hypothetical protein